MFTGLIQEIGKVLSITQGKNSLQIEIACRESLEGATIGASISVNGVCLTGIEFRSSSFVADIMAETWRSTRLKSLKTGDQVNLEKSVTPTTFLGGHLVYGDVDTVGKIIKIEKEGIATQYEIEIEPIWLKYIAQKGRVSIDGASLTVMRRTSTTFCVSLIPHSSKNLILGKMQVGSKVNIETDIIAKYCETLLSPTEEKSTATKLTIEKLINNGFI